uniref:Uncharacterized protein n=1 Tax=Timema poppense TaxID=170557 RepID=A0A7R9H760_TIMPO|nr:unnamed protein product [Timema poppensis]
MGKRPQGRLRKKWEEQITENVQGVLCNHCHIFNRNTNTKCKRNKESGGHEDEVYEKYDTHGLHDGVVVHPCRRMVVRVLVPLDALHTGVIVVVARIKDDVRHKLDRLLIVLVH